jgi:hypothetical protein
VAGERHRLVRRGRGAECFPQLDGLLDQRDAGHVVAGRFACAGAIRDLVTGHQQAGGGAHGAVAVSAELGELI